MAVWGCRVLKLLAGAGTALSLMSFMKPPQPVELPDMSHNGFKVSGGQIVAVKADSIRQDSMGVKADSLATDSTGFRDIIEGDSVTVVEDDKILLLTGVFDVEKPDTVKRDTSLMSLSYVALIAAAVPGFGQFYNKEYWKIPVMWAAIGVPLYFGIQQHNIYAGLKREYNDLLAHDAPREQIDPIQRNMILHNTWRQLLFGGAIAAYIYTLSDAVTHYPARTEHIRMATTLSFVCPGLGQLYNGSYWKIPLFVGGFATFGYMIDWNNRGYVRFDTAYKLQTDNNPDTKSEFEISGWTRGDDELKNLRNAYRRNRDLCIILTAVWYLINVLDANVDAQLKDYDISDNLAWRRVRIEPIIAPIYSQAQGVSMSYGMGINFKF